MRYRIALVLMLASIVSCGGAAAPAPEPVAPASDPAPPPAVSQSEVAPRAPAAAFTPSVERGFAHCCGNDSFRLEIRCQDRLMRCYEQDRFGHWKQTYGRHCKRELTEACYLSGCWTSC